MLQEKEKARLRKAKEKAQEKARLKAQQAQQAQQALQTREHPATFDEENCRQQNSCFIPETQNIAASIDPTWNRRYHIPDIRSAEPGSRAPIPITDLGTDFLKKFMKQKHTNIFIQISLPRCNQFYPVTDGLPVHLDQNHLQQNRQSLWNSLEINLDVDARTNEQLRNDLL